MVVSTGVVVRAAVRERQKVKMIVNQIKFGGPLKSMGNV